MKKYLKNLTYESSKNGDILRKLNKSSRITIKYKINILVTTRTKKILFMSKNSTSKNPLYFF